VVEGGRRLPNELLPGLAVALDAERPLVVHRRVRDEVLDFAAVHLEEDPLVSNLDVEVLRELLMSPDVHLRIAVDRLLVRLPPLVGAEFCIVHKCHVTPSPNDSM